MTQQQEERIKILKNLGYGVHGIYPDGTIQYLRDNSPGDHAGLCGLHEREFRAWEHPFHKYKDHGPMFDIYSPYGIVSSFSDDEFNAWVQSIPELEKKAKIELAEFIKDAEYHESIKEGKNKIENENQEEDKREISYAVDKFQEIISNMDLKSIKYKKTFDGVVEELNKLLKS